MPCGMNRQHWWVLQGLTIIEPPFILPTKLFIPPLRSEYVNRHHLICLINDNVTFKTILVSVPAGFGKTTLVCNWIRQTDKPVAWFSISEVDNDPSTFLSYVLAALQTIDSRIGQSTLPILQSSHPDYEGVLTNLIREPFTAGKNSFSYWKIIMLLKNRKYIVSWNSWSVINPDICTWLLPPGQIPCFPCIDTGRTTN